MGTTEAVTGDQAPGAGDDIVTKGFVLLLAGIPVYIGDGNNVAHSLMEAGALAFMDVRVACPPGYEPDAEILRGAQLAAAENGGSVRGQEVAAEVIEWE